MSEYRVTERDGMWCVAGTRQTASGWVQDAWAAMAQCPTREAAEAARRLLSGECARAKWPAAFFASVESALAKEEPPLPVCGVCSGGVCSEWCGYEAGKADGAAQERAKIVKWLTLHGQLSLAKFIERGEAGE